MFLLVSISILSGGAALAAIGAAARGRYLAIVQALAAALALAALAWGRRSLPQEIVMLAWRPVSLFGTPVGLTLDSHTWILALAVVAPVFASALKQATYPTEPPFQPALMLAMSAVALAALGAANLLTLALTWGFVDVVYGIALLHNADRSTVHRRQLIIGLNGVATLLAWIACIFLEQDRLSSYWRLITIAPIVQTLLALAAMLRSGIYPMYVWSWNERSDESPTILHLMPMLIGLGLWVRLATLDALPGEELWAWLALACALLAGLLAWLHHATRQTLPYAMMGYAALLIFAGSGAGLSATALTLGAAVWLLAAYGLSASPPLRPDSKPGIRNLWGLAGLIALLTLAGIPGTLGFAYRTALQAGLSQARWVWWGLATLSEALLIGAALRYLLTPAPAPATSSRWRAIVLAVSLVLAALPLIMFGVWPNLLLDPPMEPAPVSTLDIRGWVGWGLPLMTMLALAAALHLVHLSDQAHESITQTSRIIAHMFNLGWLYNLALNSVRRGARLIGGLAALTEGKAALVWTLLFIVLALLYWRGPGR